jgi:nucleoside-diphosphate-sugar epimerase
VKKALIIGGTGGVSGAIVRLLQKEKVQVWALTRGNRPLPVGVHALVADRNDKLQFESVILNTNMKFDAVFDCICMNETHAEQDLGVLSKVTSRLLVISTDSVYDGRFKRTPQTEEGMFIENPGSYAGDKRAMEKVFLRYFAEKTEKNLTVTIFRPAHIYGPGFLLGCYPEHSRQWDLANYIRSGGELRLVADGIYLIQPIFVDDLANTMIDAVENLATENEIFCVGGPEAIENRCYYELLADLLGVEAKIREVPLTGYLTAHPEFSGHLCHRIYDLTKLRNTGIKMPSIYLKDGLKCQLEAISF